jgi:hypothetical protein
MVSFSVLSKSGLRGRETVILRMVWRLFVLAWLTLAVSACDVIGGSPSIDDIVLTTALDSDYCPVDEVTTFPQNSPFYCSVTVSNLRIGSMVTSRWYFGEQSIEEISYEVQAGGSGCVGFELTSPNPWPRGGYRVEVYLNANLERAATFAVR